MHTGGYSGELRGSLKDAKAWVSEDKKHLYARCGADARHDSGKIRKAAESEKRSRQKGKITLDIKGEGRKPPPKKSERAEYEYACLGHEGMWWTTVKKNRRERNLLGGRKKLGNAVRAVKEQIIR